MDTVYDPHGRMHNIHTIFAHDLTLLFYLVTRSANVTHIEKLLKFHSIEFEFLLPSMESTWIKRIKVIKKTNLYLFVIILFCYHINIFAKDLFRFVDLPILPMSMSNADRLRPCKLQRVWPRL